MASGYMWSLGSWLSRCNIVFTAVKDIMQTEDRHTTRVFQLCDKVCSNCLHPFSCFSPYSSFLHLPLLFPTRLLRPPPSLPFSDLADNLAMDDFTFQEQLLTPRLATAGVGGVSSPAAPLWRAYLFLTLPVTLALLLLCHHWPPVHSHAPITS